jgi:hypothetical protein
LYLQFLMWYAFQEVQGILIYACMENNICVH